MTEIPEPWASAMVKQHLTDPRYRDERPSLGQLAEAANLHTTTVSRMVHGKTAPSQARVQAVADALHVDPVEVSRWVKQARSVSTPYTMPAEVHQLTEREQQAITELIRSMAAAIEELMGNAQHPAAKSEAAADRGGDGSITLAEGSAIESQGPTTGVAERRKRGARPAGLN